MRISLVMPNYNHAAYLPASVGGMLAQTRPADEIIILDDASTDDSVAVIEQLTKAHPGVRIVRHTERGGVVRALNAGLAMASGDVVAFLGADDQLYPEFLETLGPLLEAHPEAGFGCARVELRDHAGQRAGERPIVRPTGFAGYVTPAAMRRQLQHADNFFLGQVTLYRRSRLEELGGFDASLGSLSDSMLQRRLAARWGYVFVPQILGIWRVHGANYSVASATDPKVLEDMVATARRVLGDEPGSLYPPGYADLFERRLRFNSARLLTPRLAAEPATAGPIASIMRGGPGDRRVLDGVARLGPLSPLLATIWLTLRLRPVAPSWLIAEAACRLLARVARPSPPKPAPPPTVSRH